VLLIAFVRPFGLAMTSMFFLGLLLLTQIISPQSESLTNDARLLPYMPIFIMGMFLAVLQDHMNSKETNKTTRLVVESLGYIGVVGVVVMTPLIFSLFGERVPDEQFHRQFILNALFWSFILLSAVNVPGILQKIFTLPILRFYGALSFSLYLFHPIFTGAMNKLPVNGYISAWVVLLASTATAYISFTLLEAPISKYKVSRSSLAPMAHFARRFTRTK
jgi:peptidoglycan/LPS O-acetylase OafA/YrhL